MGIAGEDDLDAPGNGGSSNLGHAEKMNGSAHIAAVPNAEPKNREHHKITRGLDHTRLPSDQSAALRERLLCEIAALQSIDAATTWAQDGIITKNNLAATDAKLVEEAFALKLSELSGGEPGEAVSDAISTEPHATPLE